MGQKIERVKTSLQIEENIDLHIRGWIIQRIGWGLMLVFILSAAMGLFGNGFLSKAMLVEGQSSITFEKFTRRECQTEIALIAPHQSGKLQLVLSPVFAESFKVEKVVPEPASQQVRNGSIIYEFTGEGQGQFTLFLETRKTGSVHSTITVNSDAFVLSQFIYP